MMSQSSASSIGVELVLIEHPRVAVGKGCRGRAEIRQSDRRLTGERQTSGGDGRGDVLEHESSMNRRSSASTITSESRGIVLGNACWARVLGDHERLRLRERLRCFEQASMPASSRQVCIVQSCRLRRSLQCDCNV
jgi:hypothetical protein